MELWMFTAKNLSEWKDMVIGDYGCSVFRRGAIGLINAYYPIDSFFA
jgi:hypothetical protein